MKDEQQPKSSLECIYCYKEFKYASEKKRHELSHCFEFECRLCLKKFSFLSALRRHEKQHERKGTVQCKEGDGSFRDETLLKRHIKYAHKGTFSCAKCLATFCSEAALNTHTKIHKPKEERKYKCSFQDCDKSFNFPHHLKHHELTHTNCKQHFCCVCGKGFIQSHHLKRHLKTHEPESWLPCVVPGCVKRFATDYARKRHYATHKTNKSGANIPDDDSICTDDKDFLVCATCGELVAKGKLSAHTANCMKTEHHSPPCDSPVNLSKLDNINLTENEQQETVRNQTHSIHVEEPYTSDVRHCNNAIGGCIVTGGSDINENCLCAQISPKMEESYCEIDVVSPYDTKSELPMLSKNQNYTEVLNNPTSDACEGCDCSRHENKNYDKCMVPENVSVIKLEYRLDGVVKLEQNEFDVDTEFSKNDKNYNVRNNDELRLHCKAILGNCIVSGDDTIGEGCLCAKMSQSALQATSQEIDEITICAEDNWQ